MLPLAWLTLAVPREVRRSSSDSPRLFSADVLASTRTDGRWPPLMVTRPTPLICEIFCASRVSARSSILVSGSTSEVSDRVSTGASAGLTLLYTGGYGRLAGKKVPAALIAACTSCSATSSDSARSNCKVTTEAPSELVEPMDLRPGISPNWRSSGAVIDELITSGLAPGYWVNT